MRGQWKRIAWTTALAAALTWTGTVGTAPLAPTAQAAAAYYVSESGNDAWSGTLASPNGSGTDGPFKTVERARDAMRASGMKTTYLRGGTYYVPQTLELNASDNGVAFRAYGNETPVLSGGELVTGFTPESNGIYAAPLATPSDIELVFDGSRQRVAEKKAYDAANPFTYAHYFAEDSTALNKIVFKAGDVSASDFVSTLKVDAYGPKRWENDILPVTSIDPNTNTIHLGGNVKYAIRDNGTYRLLNNPAFLNETGEFAYRASDGKLLFKPSNAAKLLSEGAVVPRRTIVSLNGAEGVVFNRLTFAHTPYSLPAIELKNGATGNHFYNNLLVHVGKAFFLNNAPDNDIAHNEMASIGTTGVELAYGSNGNRIDWNFIHHVGAVRKNGGGVVAYGVHDNRVYNNRIEDTARYGVSIKRWDTATLHSGNIVEYNKIVRTNRETSDTGAIEMLGRGANDTNTIIRYNYIQNTGGLMSDWVGPVFQYPYGADGIYLDDETSGVEVFGNFIKDTSRAGVFVHAGDNNVIRNNVAIIGKSIWKGLGHEDGKDKFVRLEWGTNQRISSNTTIDRNIVYSVTSSWPKYLDFFNGGTYATDRNVLYNVPKVSGKDALSTVADPLFVNASAGNYELQSGSPAYAQGFVDLPWNIWNQVQGAAGIEPPEWQFHKGINLNGAAATIEGQAWLSHSTALTQGLSLPGGANTFAKNPPLTPSPQVGAAVRDMLNTGVWKSKATLSIDQTVPSGTYQLYLWVMENNSDFYRAFGVAMEGQTKDADVGALALNHWARYGPYVAQVTDGTLNVQLTFGTQDPLLAGIELYKRR